MLPSSQASAPPAFVRLAAHPLRWRLLTELANSDHRVRELAAQVNQPQNLVSYHLRLLRDGGLVTATRSSFDGRDSYYHLDLDRCADALTDSGAALHPAFRREVASPTPPTPPAARQRSPRTAAVLFVCTGNSARSPIAEALLRHHAAGSVTVTSAGSQPKRDLHPNTTRVLREAFGIDVANQRPQHLDTLAGRGFDQVITLCDRAREVCPEFPDHARRIHWSLPDPAKAGGDDQASYPAFQRIAADIDARIRYLIPILADVRRVSHDRT
ncbi:ArsR family transcriptional regulator [Actinopolymorpha alba]|uniref:arsenate reductase/protein-tyrosine-phosphatase family protein n=1 Tax=Actinopolymorpha alba TaxID=533267 RepID=UPI00036D9A07|nr:ArsR family transcriptional regulator [Actinopolymorpha alba]